jgi:hypothetical protein
MQRTELYRAGLALALAFDRIIKPERKRRVPLDAPVANDLSVYHFTTEELEFPLTPEVREWRSKQGGLHLSWW